MQPRAWRNLPDGRTDGYLHPEEFYLGTSDRVGQDICVRVVSSSRAPSAGDLERLWQAFARTPVLLLVARYETEKGPTVDLVGGHRRSERARPHAGRPRPIIVKHVASGEALNFCRLVLEETSTHNADRLIARWMDERATDLPGLKNDGLFARQALLHYVPDRSDWITSYEKAVQARQKTGRSLVESLGFALDEAADPSAAILVANGTNRAVGLFLDASLSFDEPTIAFGASSPVTHGLAIATRLGLPWVILTRGTSIRLHPVSADIGVGRRGRSATYVELNLSLLPENQSPYLWLLFGADALTVGGSVDQILDASKVFAADLGGRLRDRVYVRVIPTLAKLLGRGVQAGLSVSETRERLADAYHRTMVVLFRTLFVAYAEDRGLLPYGRNQRYTEESLKRLAQHLASMRTDEVSFDGEARDLWQTLTWTWRTVASGNTECGVPPYDGSLFVAGSGMEDVAELDLTNEEIGPVLTDLLVDTDRDDVVGPVDFRSLSVREFGTIYEGLLESELSMAENDLAVDRDGNFVPAKAGAEVVVGKGDIYFHNRSGERKATGSYFTKPFAVEHLLDTALEPAVSRHLESVKQALDSDDDAEASRKLFDFRCADLSMGSGHFLIAAIDRLEARFSQFLTENPIPNVNQSVRSGRRLRC